VPIRDTSGGRKATATATASPFRSRIQREGAPKRQTSSKAGNARSYARRARHKKEKEGPATAKPTAKTNPRSTFQVRVLCIIEHPPPSEANRILSLACARLLEETVSLDPRSTLHFTRQTTLYRGVCMLGGPGAKTALRRWTFIYAGGGNRGAGLG